VHPIADATAKVVDLATRLDAELTAVAGPIAGTTRRISSSLDQVQTAYGPLLAKSEGVRNRISSASFTDDGYEEWLRLGLRVSDSPPYRIYLHLTVPSLRGDGESSIKTRGDLTAFVKQYGPDKAEELFRGALEALHTALARIPEESR
jgi:hypothetical protein